ncbi:MAG: hypothetical protein WDN28_04360 [Chthoniobacter sp.]
MKKVVRKYSPSDCPETWGDDLAEEKVTGVAVLEVRPGLEVRRVLCHRGDQVRGRDRLRHPGEKIRPVGVAVQAGSVREQMPQGNLRRIRHRGKIFRQRIADGQFALLGQIQDRGGGELLRHRADAEFRLRRDRRLLVHIGQSIAALEENLPIARHQHGCPRHVPLHFLAKMFLRPFRRRLREEMRQEKASKKRCAEEGGNLHRATG